MSLLWFQEPGLSCCNSLSSQDCISTVHLYWKRIQKTKHCWRIHAITMWHFRVQLQSSSQQEKKSINASSVVGCNAQDSRQKQNTKMTPEKTHFSAPNCQYIIIFITSVSPFHPPALPSKFLFCSQLNRYSTTNFGSAASYLLQTSSHCCLVRKFDTISVFIALCEIHTI